MWIDVRVIAIQLPRKCGLSIMDNRRLRLRRGEFLPLCPQIIDCRLTNGAPNGGLQACFYRALGQT